jgi:hypothetical protein
LGETVTLTTERAQKRRVYEARKAAGQCVKCGGEPTSGRTTCLACRAKKGRWDRAYIARQRALWKPLGICIVCGVRQAIRKQTRCGYCAEAAEAAYARRKAG